MLNTFKKLLHKLHHDETGDIPIGPMLIIALIVIPLVIILVTFKESIVKKFNSGVSDLGLGGEGGGGTDDVDEFDIED